MMIEELGKEEEVPLTCFQSRDSQRISLNTLQSLMIVRDLDERGGTLQD